MTFRKAIDLYLRDAQSDGRLASPSTVRTYLSRLERLADTVSNRDPRTVGREDIKRCLNGWPNLGTQAHALSIFVAFFEYLEQEGHLPNNPARKVRRPRFKKTQRYRFTLDETTRTVAAASGIREQRAILLPAYAGVRNAELRGLKGLHFQRPGFIWISKDIGKGNVERWVPVLPELEAVVAGIVATTAPGEFVLPSEKLGATTRQPSSSQALCKLVRRVMQRAGIAAAFDPDSRVGPHTLRHSFCDYVRRSTGDVEITRALMGHLSIRTTQGYMSQPTLDELSRALRLPPVGELVMAGVDGGGREPHNTSVAPVEPEWLRAWLDVQAPKVALYAKAFGHA